MKVHYDVALNDDVSTLRLAETVMQNAVSISCLVWEKNRIAKYRITKQHYSLLYCLRATYELLMRIKQLGWYENCNGPNHRRLQLQS